MAKRTLMSWSSGKDSAWALYKLQQNPEIDLVGIFCTVNKKYDRVAMHGVRVELLEAQASSIGLPLEILEIPDPCSNVDYEYVMSLFTARAKNNNIDYIAFGDLFLEDIRDYRITKLKDTGIKPVFPVWGMPTGELARDMVRSGLRAIITCVDPKQIPARFVGKEFDDVFLDLLPSGIDPCGEYGEFHSFVFDGPMFKHKIEIKTGDIVNRDNFIFADIFPVNYDHTNGLSGISDCGMETVVQDE